MLHHLMLFFPCNNTELTRFCTTLMKAEKSFPSCLHIMTLYWRCFAELIDLWKVVQTVFCKVSKSNQVKVNLKHYYVFFYLFLICFWVSFNHGITSGFWGLVLHFDKQVLFEWFLENSCDSNEERELSFTKKHHS